VHEVRWYLLVETHSTSGAVEHGGRRKNLFRYVYWMSSYWSAGKSKIHICRVKRLKNAGGCLERWISAVLHLLFSMTHILSASGELLIGSKKSAVESYDSSPLWYKIRVMSLGCLECYIN
jgi:hypothetical protein